MNLNFLIPYISYLVFFIVGLIILYIRTYIIEKAKNRVLSKSNAELTQQTEQIKARYSKEIEEVKKTHQLDIEKRKYQYESKKEQYLKFFQFLDEFNARGNVGLQEKFVPVFEEFNRNYLKAADRNSKKDQTNATTVFSSKLQKILMEGNNELFRIKQETNTIRLIASDDVIETLDLLQLSYNKSFESSSKMLKDLPAHMQVNNQNAMSADRNEIEIIGKVIISYKNDLIRKMRAELKEI